MVAVLVVHDVERPSSIRVDAIEDRQGGAIWTGRRTAESVSRPEIRRSIDGGNDLLAGGQSLVGAMKLRLASPDNLIDIGGIAELRGIKREGNNIVIGATTRHDSPEEHL